MFDDFPGKVAIVAGGAGAMGASQVRKLHADGARVVVPISMTRWAKGSKPNWVQSAATFTQTPPARRIGHGLLILRSPRMGVLTS